MKKPKASISKKFTLYSTLILLFSLLVSNITATEENRSNQTLQNNLSLIQNNISFVIENNSLPEIETNNETANTTPAIPATSTIPSPASSPSPPITEETPKENPANPSENNQENSPQINSPPITTSPLVSPQSSEPRFSLFTTPSISAVILNSTNPSTNDTNQNLTSLVTATDADTDNITFAYNWYKENILNATTFINDGTALVYLPLNNDTLDYALSNNGVINGAPVQIFGKIGNAYYFDQIDDYLGLSSAGIPTGGNPPLTVTAWVSRNGTNTLFRPIFGMGLGAAAGTHIAFGVGGDSDINNAGDNLWVSHWGADTNTGINLSTGLHHIVYVSNATGDTLYLDGTRVYSLTTSFTVGSDPTLRMGSWDDKAGTPYYFNGTIDEFQIYNRSLSAAEVTQLYIGSNWSGNRMHSSKLSNGDNWTLGVRAADYENWSAETNSSNFRVLANAVPSITSVILNSTNSSINDTNQNLTSLVTATDANTDNMTFIYNWYKENTLNATTLFNDNSLKLYLPFNNDTLDYALANDGTSTNGAFLNYSGKVGGAYQFDGADDNISLGTASDLNLTGEKTIAAWYKTSFTYPLGATDSRSYIVSKGNFSSHGAPYIMGIDASNSIASRSVFFFWRGSGTNYGASSSAAANATYVADGQWHFLAGSVNSSNDLMLYSDGVLVRTDTENVAATDGGDNILVGATNGDKSNFTGLIDEVQIYNRSLSAHEIYQLYIGSNFSGHTMHSSRLAQSDNWILGVKVGDSTGFSNETNSSTLQIPDSTTPVVTINQPLNKTLNSLPILFNVTINENATTAQFSLNGGANNITMQNNANRDFNSTNTSLADGSYTVNYYVNDTVNNFNNTAKRSFTLDTIFPTIQYVSPTSSGSIFTTLKDILVNITSTDSNSLSNITIQLFNSSGARIRYNTTSTSPNDINYSLLADGTYTFNATATDAGNNINSTASRNVTIDTTIPLVQFVSPTNSTGLFTTENNFTINVTATDTSLSNITIQLFNSSGARIRYNTTSTSPNNITYANLADGVYFFNATATDLANNINSTSSRNITVDTIFPLISYISPTQDDGANISGNYIYINVSLAEINFANITFYLFNDTAAVNTTVFTSQTLFVNFSSLADTNYSYQVNITDLANQKNSTGIRKIRLDLGIPSIQFVSPTETNNTFANRNYLLANATATDPLLTNITIFLFNSSLSLIDNTTTTTSPNFKNFSSLANGKYFIVANATDSSSNINSTEIRTVTLDTIQPTIQFVDPSAATNTFTNLKDILVNITSIDTNLANITIQLFNSSGSRIRYNTTSTSPNSINYSLLADGDYSFNATATDNATNINSTSSRNVTIDTKAPNVTLITFYLNSSDSVDPSGNLTFNATVADDRMSVGTVILQYHNGTTWANKTMLSQGSNVYQANISLAITNQSYAYNIYANDTVGNINLTTNATFNSFFDCTFTRTPADLGATAGFNENKFTGNISINNTGDPDYPNNNCNLTFRLTHELTEGRVCFNNICFKPSNTIDIAAKVNTTIKTNGSFLSEIKEETFNISISELTFRASTNHSNASISLVSTTGGPYLFQKITASPATLSLITQNFTLEGYVRNLVGDGTTNNTAYNVTLNWTLPSDFLIKDGNISSNFTNLSDSATQQKPINITLNATNLPSMSAGTLTVSLYSQGTNSTNTLINHTGGRTLLVEQANITFTCSNVSDGIIVTACSSLDGDFVAAPSSSSSTTGGGGGGGSSGGEIVETVQTTSDFQVVRGKQNTIQIPFINKDNNDSIRDITIKVSGNIAKYITISPSSIPSLGPGDETTLSLLITSPSYLPLGREEIKIEIEGRLRNEVYKEIKKIVLEIHELSQEEAKALLKESEALMKKFNEAGFNITSLNNLLAESQKVINDFAYEKVRDNHAIIKNTVTKALDSKKIIDELTKLIAIAEEKGIPVPESSKLLKLAKLSLERNDFEEAFARAKEAQVAYALEVKGEIGKIVYYLKNYPGTISLTAIILVLFSVTAYKITKFNYLSSRIKRLKEEELILTELMKVVQRDAFEKKSMSMEEYETAMQQYEQKLEKVIEEIIELESKRAYALKFTGEKSRLSLERDRLISLIKELQRDYLQKRKMETRSYELKTESYNRRIGEIDQHLATLEAKQATKGGLNIFR